MSKASFVHLHTHTHYSLLKSSCTVSHLVDQCIKHQQPALAITDYGNMFGVLDMYFSAMDKGVKPILGLDICLSLQPLKHRESKPVQQKYCNLVLLAQNQEGYKNLCKINTIAYKEGFYYVPRIDLKNLEQHNQGVIALTGGFSGVLNSTYLKSGPDAALKILSSLKSIYKDRLYMEINRINSPEWDRANTFLMETGKKENIPLIATNNVHYLNRKDRMVQDVLHCIGINRTLHDRSRERLPSDQLYFKSSEEMKELFHDLPEACEGTLHCHERCNLQFTVQKGGRPIYHLPRLKLSEGAKNPKTTLKELSFKGLQKRWEELKKQNKNLSETDKNTYKDRLEKELKIITTRGFSDYFLIIYDFVHWAKEQGIPVGPGRGSGASSLVAYCLEITDLNPMPYHLLFERFLNPERISLPDFDVDFCQENRGRVIEYVTEKYGEDYVAQVMTYGRLQARAATRDVGRVMGMSYTEVDRVAKLIPEKLGITLKQAVESNTQLKELMDTDPQVKTLITLARQIEGLIRHASIHAAGVIIANHPIRDYAPLYPGAQRENVIQSDLYHTKKIGLVKFDFLGLKTLTHIRQALQLINKKNHSHLSEKNISLQDPGIYEIMCRGDTKGVFQFEGEGITDLLKKAQPSCFEDIVAINALYRPGPMEMIPSYLERKKGLIKVEYLFSELEFILKETYGVIVYQEQVLLIAARIAGYSYGEADVLRRAMGEKKTSVMKKQKTRFLTGAKKNNFDLKKSEKLFDLVAEFAKYGFNKSHAAAYCVLAAQTAYLKKYHPVEFFASLLTVEINNTDKMIKYVADTKAHGIKVLPPHINHSEYLFTTGENCIYFSLGAIKGVGRPAVDAIQKAKNTLKDKKFKSVMEFFETMDTKKVTKKTIESLVKAGAFSGMDINESGILSNYENLLKQVEQKKQDKASGQITLFQKTHLTPVLKSSTLWSEEQKLEYEKSVMGFYLSQHPLNRMEYLRESLKVIPIASLSHQKHKSSCFTWGLLEELREITTKKGNTMAFGKLEDNTGSVEVVFFSDVYEKFEQHIKTKKALLVKATLEKNTRSNGNKLIAGTIQPVEERIHHCQRVVIYLTDKEQDKLHTLKSILMQYTGEVPLYFSVQVKNKNIPLKLNMTRGVRVNLEFLSQISKVVGDHKKVRIF